MIRRTKALLYRGTLAVAVTVCYLLYHSEFVLSVCGHTSGEEETSATDLESLVLTEQQCAATFPGLTNEIDDIVARGPFTLDRKPDDYTGLVHGRIKDGKLYIISTDNNPSQSMVQEQHSVLHQLHRAIITSPNPLPDTLFTFCVIDTPTNNSWTFSRSNDPAWEAGGNFWVMPHFSFWSWPLPFIGTMDQALSKIEKIEKEMVWKDKIDKAVWRGTAWFNSVANRDLRPSLVLQSKGKEWADVETLAWHNNAEDASNAIAIHDFCKYKYIIYTEGITYSGRLPFHQACASVIISPPIGYLLHTTHLIRPVFSTSFLPQPQSPTSSTAYDWWKSLWPHPYEASEANIVFVKPDWSDLEETIAYLRTHPEIASGIAQRQRDVFKRYLSPAAEVCYWRALIKGWSEVARPNYEPGSVGAWNVGGVDVEEGMRFETYSLLGKLKSK